MANNFNRDKVNVKFVPNENPEETKPSCMHQETGVSSLYGRVNDNLTHVNRGIYGTRPWSSVFPGAYYDAVKALGRLFRIFF